MDPEEGLGRSRDRGTVKIRWLASIRDPKAPTREEIEAGLDLGTVPDIGMVVDIGEPPAGWCPLLCECGRPCREFAGHRNPCDCGPWNESR
jgi:hypothetical protein